MTTRINIFELSDFVSLSSGACGDVYKAKCRGKTVAVKSIKISKLYNQDKKSIEEIISDFENEVAITSQSPHPNVVQFLGVCTENSKLMIITEFMEGGSIEKLLFERKFSLLTRLRMARDVAAGMTWMSPRIIHRDLKLGNLLLGPNNTVKICDFGFSQLTDGQPIRDLKSVKGSPSYIAPEVWKGHPFDYKTDVYSFGVVLYELIMEREAYASKKYENWKDLRKFVVNDQGRPDFTISFEKEYTELVSLIKRCWDQDPDCRPTFSEIGQSLDDIIIKVAIKDQLGRQFWTTHFRDRSHVSWPEFWAHFHQLLVSSGWQQEPKLDPLDPLLEKKIVFATDAQLQGLRQSLDQRSQDLVKRELIRRYRSEFMQTWPPSIEEECFKSIFASASNREGAATEMVTIDNFGLFLTFIGPIVESSGNVQIVDRIKRTLSQEWFHGYMSPQQAEILLKDYFDKGGAFMVRFSVTTPGCYTISKTRSDGEYYHKRIEYIQSTSDVSSFPSWPSSNSTIPASRSSSLVAEHKSANTEPEIPKISELSSSDNSGRDHQVLHNGQHRVENTTTQNPFPSLSLMGEEKLLEKVGEGSFLLNGKYYPTLEAAINTANIHLWGNLPPCRGSPFTSIFNARARRQYLDSLDEPPDSIVLGKRFDPFLPENNGGESVPPVKIPKVLPPG